MKTKILLIFICAVLFVNSSHSKNDTSHSVQIQQNAIAKEVSKAKSRKDFERVLSKLGLLNSFGLFRNEVIDAAMSIPPPKKLIIFYYVGKSSAGPNNNECLFKAYKDIPEEELETLHQAASILFHKTNSNSERSSIIWSLKNLKNEKRITMANYINGILFCKESRVGSRISDILRIPEDDISDVIGRTLTIYNRIGEDGSEDLIRYLASIPKERRDFIMSEAKKLYNKEMTPISKGHLINGLAELNNDDFYEIVALGKQLFFEDTTGGHMSLIMRALQKGLNKNQRTTFVKQVKPLLKFDDSSMTRSNIVCVMSKFSEDHIKIFLGYMPLSMCAETKKKLFDNLSYISCINISYNEEGKAKEQEVIEKLIKYLQENLPSQQVSEEKFLTTILSAIQNTKMS